MCNFVIRPIRSIATVDLVDAGGKTRIKRGQVFQVNRLDGQMVIGTVNDVADVNVPIQAFIRSFIIGSHADMEKMLKEEEAWVKAIAELDKPKEEPKPKDDKAKETKPEKKPEDKPIVKVSGDKTEQLNK